MMTDRNKHHIKIAVVEDSEFYNRLMTSQIQHHVAELELEHDCVVEIQSYVRTADFLNSIDADLDVVIMDFYLDMGHTALDVIRSVKKMVRCCKVAVMSQSQKVFAAVRSLKIGAAGFINKEDKYAILRACFFVEEAIKLKLSMNQFR